MSISQNFPAEGPTLNLNFAGSKKLDPRITFTRTSTATYMDDNGLITIAPTNTPRFEHSVVGVGSTVTGVESLGLLIEESRTNLITYSEQFDNAAWIKTNVGITTNSAVSPDGTTTAEEVSPTTAGSQLRNVSQNYTISTAQSYTLSAFVKKTTLTNNLVAFRISNHTSTADVFANFNFSTETFGSVSVTAGWTGSTTVQKFPNDWYRLSITANTAAATHTILSAQIWLGGYQGTTETIGNCLVWGAQFEAGAFPTSYIPTVASTVTRSADNASMTGTNFSSWYNSSEGTSLLNYRVFATSGDQPVIEFNDGTSSNRMLFVHQVGSVARFLTFSGGSAVVATLDRTAVASNSKWTGAYKASDYASTYNANSALTNTYGAVISGVNKLQIGSSTGGSFYNGYIQSISYYPTRLTNSQLQNLTK